MSDEENAALVVKEGMKQFFAPYHDLINKLLGPAATEVGLSWGDSIKVWRLGVSFVCYKKSSDARCCEQRDQAHRS